MYADLISTIYTNGSMAALITYGDNSITFTHRESQNYMETNNSLHKQLETILDKKHAKLSIGIVYLIGLIKVQCWVCICSSITTALTIIS